MAHLLSLLEGAVAPERKIVCGQPQQLTLSQLAERCKALGKALQYGGISSLALHMDNGPEWIVVDIACQLASVRLTPLPTWFSSSQLGHVLDSVAPDAVITQQPLIWKALPGGNRMLPVDLPVEVGQALRMPAGRKHAGIPLQCDKVTFTSGSTGQPKGVCLDNRLLLEQAAVLAEQVGLKAPRHLCVLPLSTLLENIAGVYAPLLANGEVHVPTLSDLGYRGSSDLDPERFLGMLQQIQPNSVILTPQLLRLLVIAAGKGWQAPSSLQFVAVGGAHVPGGLIEQAHQQGIPAYEGYGLSECASVVTLNVPGRQREGSCGKPLPILDLCIEEGEIVVLGNTMLGYVGEPKSWQPSRIYTGDLGHVDEAGFVYIDGRKKNLLINSYGRNISPEWVENEMLAHGDLSECVVFGDGRPYCVALLGVHDPATPNAVIQDWIDQCNAQLPDYSRIQSWHRLSRPLAHYDGLLTDNGRPRRDAILKRFQAEIEQLYPTPEQEVFA